MNDICGVLVHSRPEQVDSARRALDAMPGVEVHVVTGDGRLVVSVEEADGAMPADVIARFHQVDGVVNAALVYHYSDADEEP